MTERKQHIKQAVTEKADEISALDDIFFGEVIGISQASEQLRESLDRLDKLINQREYEKAAQLGYDDIASAFIFLQRCLGGLNDTCLSKDSMISDTIVGIGSSVEKLSYEEMAPYFKEAMFSLQPRDPRPVEEIDFKIEVNKDIVAWFKAQGGNHKTHMAKVLSLHHAEHQVSQLMDKSNKKSASEL